ncbi:hypothetical protein [Catenulispora subtropica]|uniref:Uncharacterized protein n=1 Tax=Catenulispora subtropica TaxID=450798 RepID=A0ABP5CHQ8_9ACTN
MLARPVHETDVSNAWLQALTALHNNAQRSALHTVVTIDDPTAEDPQVRAEADRLLAQFDMAPINTVANTIFPASLAALSDSHEDLVNRYHEIYPLLRSRWHQNSQGTYFGRLIAFGASGTDPGYDQLGAIIRKLAAEHARGNGKTALYEAAFGNTGGFDDTEDAVEGDRLPPPVAAAATIYSAEHDKLPVGGFPCLSHCSFQLDREGRVHALAQYRSQYLVERGYGNYLGLGRLLDYVCRQTGLARGRLTVTAGYAQIEVNITKVRALLSHPKSLF